MNTPHRECETRDLSPEEMFKQFGAFVPKHVDAELQRVMCDRLSKVSCPSRFFAGDEHYIIAVRVSYGASAMDCALIVTADALDFARGALWGACSFNGFEGLIVQSEPLDATTMTIEELGEAARELLDASIMTLEELGEAMRESLT